MNWFRIYEKNNNIINLDEICLISIKIYRNKKWHEDKYIISTEFKNDALDSEIEGKIMKCLKSTNFPLNDREIEQKTKVKSRKGTTHYERVKKSLLQEGTIILVKEPNRKYKPKMWLVERYNELPEGYEVLTK